MLEFKDATVRVGEQILATRLSFIARDGEMTCVTGPEGSGKTTLLRTLMGFLPVSEGFVSVDGELLTIHSSEVEEPEPDEYAVWNAMLPAANAEVVSAPLNAEDILLLAEKTLKEAADKPIVIADEPTACLTPELTMRMLDLLRQQAKEGKTVLVASRKPQVVDYADQVIQINR